MICEYIEDAYPQNPLLPADPFARNRVRQIMRVAEQHLELPNRRLIGFAFSGTEAPEPLLDEVRAVVERGINSMNALATFDPWVAGSDYTMCRYISFLRTCCCRPRHCVHRRELK